MMTIPNSCKPWTWVDGWLRWHHAYRTMKADDDGNVESEVVVVRTDIAAPTSTAFAKVPGQALDANPKT